MKKNILLFLMGLLFGPCVLSSNAGSLSQDTSGIMQDSLALLSIRNHLIVLEDDWPDKKDYFSSWYDQPMSKWNGVSLDRATGRVTGLYFSSNIVEFRGEIPPEIGDLTELRTLEAFFYQRIEGLTKLPPEIGNLTKLRSISIYGSPLMELPETMGGLYSLTSLNLENNKVKSLPESIGQLQNLTALTLKGNLIETVPASLFQMRRLVNLDLSNNYITTLPSGLGQMSKLEKLVLNYNTITVLPSGFGAAPTLKFLGLDHNQLRKMPNQMGGLGALQVLTLANNRIEGGIPLTYVRLENLKSFKVEGNSGLCRSDDPDFMAWVTAKGLDNLADLPLCPTGPTCQKKDNGTLVKLKDRLVFSSAPDGSQQGSVEAGYNDKGCISSLYFKGHISGDIGPEVGLLSELESIKFTSRSKQPFGRLPKEIGDLSRLETIEFKNAGRANLPEAIGKLSSLKTLIIENGDVETMPETIGSVRSLQNLEISHCGLTSIPASISHLSSLKKLKLFNNKLKTIPERLGYLQQLHDLKLDYNQLERLPQTLGELGNLSYISFSNNRMSGTIPASFKKLSKLSGIGIGGNELCRPLDAEFEAWAKEKRLDNVLALPVCSVGLCQERDNRALLAIEENLVMGTNSDHAITVGYNEEGCMNHLSFRGDISGDISPEIGKLLDLESLEQFSYDQVAFGKLPPEISNLVKLKKVSFNGALNVRLTEELLKLPELKRLSLTFCGLTEIPGSVGMAQNLEFLQLQHNKISGSLPMSMVALEKLQKLNVGGNGGLCRPAHADFDAWVDSKPRWFFDGKVPYCIPTKDTEAPAQRTALTSPMPVRGLELHGNIPNPVHGTTRISFSVIQKETKVRLVVFNPLGQKVMEQEGTYQAGQHYIVLDVGYWPEGIYTYYLQSEKHTLPSRLVKR